MLKPTGVEQQLNAARANAERTDTFWGKLTGRHQAAQEEAETLTLNLASIRQREPAPERQQAPERATERQPDQDMTHASGTGAGDQTPMGRSLAAGGRAALRA